MKPQNVGWRHVALALSSLLIIGLATLTSCAGGSSDDSIEYLAVAKADTYGGVGDQTFYVETDGYVDLTYTLDGLNGEDVYFVLTNTNPYDAVTNPVISGSVSAGKAARSPRRSLVSADQARTRTPAHIQAFNAKPPALGRGSAKAAASLVVPEPVYDYTEGVSTRQFYDANGAAIDADGPGVGDDITAQVVRTVVGSTTLVIWVDDSEWSTNESDIHKVTPNRVVALADKFLTSGTNNDIYDWVTNIFGAPWGPHIYAADLIGWSPLEVHILMFDIDGDGLPGAGEARTVGYFYARDNFRHTDSGAVTDKSNELVMFTMDAALFGCHDTGDDDLDGYDWDLTDSWPATVVSTLAHEFQHMIHFYQKGVLKGANSETWLNEMASQVAEDLIASKLATDGPRGVAYDDPTAGAANNTAGRLPYFNYYNDISLTGWGTVDVLGSYGISYAFGAYLARNFGGAHFFQDLVQSSYGDYRAVEDAIGQAGWSYTFADALRLWGAAVLLSDNALGDAATDDQRYNWADWFSDTVSSITYDLGSINLYNYNAGTLVGPWLYDAANPWSFPNHMAASNLYYTAATGATGSRTWTIRMDAGVKLTVVVKE